MDFAESDGVAERRLRARVDSGFLTDAAERRGRISRDGTCRSIGVIGGGTAGYLTALAIRKAHPELEVTLVESSSVPIIGVGEATTPLMPNFLHGLLGFEIQELFDEVKPTFKLGIRFEWGEPGDSYFNYPFGPSSLLEPYTYDKNITNYSLYSMLMSAGALPLVEANHGQHHSFLKPYTAYHLDNVRFVGFLTKKAKERGVKCIDALIDRAETCDGFDGCPEIAGIHLADGRRLQFDLYLDCTGFRSLLLEKTLQSKFISYEKSLFTDTAIVADVPHGGRLKPYTLAETMDSGWCWNIPQVELDHRGYVFSSAFCKREEAIAEMRRKNPSMHEHRIVTFRSGRHEVFWQSNVIAIGNAYAFVEPLESTALHMIITQIRLLLDVLPVRMNERGIPRFLNRKVAEHWDYIKWFLSLHYRFNRKLDTPFWRACREETDVSEHGELLSYFQERGPLSYHPSGPGFFKIPDPLWGPSGIDVILLGQKVPSRVPLPVGSEADWKERLKLRQEIVSVCLKQEQAIKVLESHAPLLRQFGHEASNLRAEYVTNPGVSSDL
jgi:tryptophan halogenase